jgi:outer membrane protein assembly factor BamB
LWHAEVETVDIQRVHLFRDLICLESSSLDLYAIDPSTGLIRWQKKLSVPLGVVPCDNCKQMFYIEGQRLCAIEKATGNPMWRADLHFTPTAAPGASDETVFVPTVGRGLHGYSAADGRRNYDFYTRNEMDAAPVADSGSVFTGDTDGWIYGIDLVRKESPWEKKPRLQALLAWEKQTRGSIAAPLCLAEKLVLAGSKDYKIYALEKATGTTAWQISTGSMVLDQPVYVEGLVYVVSYQNGVHVYDLAKGDELWKLPDGVAFVAAAGNKNAYLLNEKGKIVALDKKSGKTLWMLAPTRYDFVLKNPWTSHIFLVSKDGRVAAIAEKEAKMLTYQPPAPPAPKLVPKKAPPKAPAPKTEGE